ncbi:MAG: hypothetical protein ACI3V5_04890 [Faecousia sp.]
MAYSITDTYKMKREILNFSKKFSTHLSSPEAKFTADMTYGIVASKSCLLTLISQRLQENTKKRYTVDRLSDHLARGIPKEALTDYLRYIRSITPSEPVIHIDDSDVVNQTDIILNSWESFGTVPESSEAVVRSFGQRSIHMSTLDQAAAFIGKIQRAPYRQLFLAQLLRKL